MAETEIKDNKTIKNIFLSVLYIAFFSILLLLIWGINRGFDFTDEGFYMLSYSNPYEPAIKVFSYFSFFYEILKHFNPGIITYRVIRLVLTLISSLVFSIAFSKLLSNIEFIKDSYLRKTKYIFPFIATGTFLSYAVFPKTPSYNSFTIILLQFSLALIMLILNKDAYSKFISFVFILLGIILSLLFFIKISSAILFFPFIVLFFFIYRNGDLKVKLKYLCYDIFLLSLGFLVGIYLYSLTVRDTFKLISELPIMIKMFPAHNSKDVLTFYFFNITGTLGHVLKDFAAVFILVIIYIYIKIYTNTTFRYRSLILKFILIAAIFVFFERVYMLSLYKCGSDYIYAASRIYIMILIFLLISILVFYISSKRLSITLFKSGKKEILICALFFVLPFIGSFGTNILLSIHVLVFMFSWFALLYILIAFIEINILKDIRLNVMLLVIMLFSMIHIFYGFAIYPYRLNAGLFKQSATIENIKNAEGLKFDKETKQYIQDVNQILSAYPEYHEKPLMISLYDNPGLIYLLGGISAGSNWYAKPKYEIATEANCYSIRNSKLTNLNSTILLIEKNAIVPRNLIKAFNEKGISFPHNYKIAGKVCIPRINDTLCVWVPKS